MLCLRLRVCVCMCVCVCVCVCVCDWLVAASCVSLAVHCVI